MNAEASSADQLRKAATKGEIDIKVFMKEYLDKRVKYHKYDILKVKIA